MRFRVIVTGLMRVRLGERVVVDRCLENDTESCSGLDRLMQEDLGAVRVVDFAASHSHDEGGELPGVFLDERETFSFHSRVLIDIEPRELPGVSSYIDGQHM